MSLKKLLLPLLTTIFMLSSAATYDGDSLRVGVEGAYPPFSLKEADGTLKGSTSTLLMKCVNA